MDMTEIGDGYIVVWWWGEHESKWVNSDICRWGTILILPNRDTGLWRVGPVIFDLIAFCSIMFFFTSLSSNRQPPLLLAYPLMSPRIYAQPLRLLLTSYSLATKQLSSTVLAMRVFTECTNVTSQAPRNPFVLNQLNSTKWWFSIRFSLTAHSSIRLG